MNGSIAHKAQAGLEDIGSRMERMYRPQRHIYDATRRFYLVGRDRMIDHIRAEPGACILDVGCGTGRNLARIARAYPDTALFGIDAAPVMLESARRRLAAAGMTGRLMLAHAAAEELDPRAQFPGCDGFDHVLFSYSLSMMDAPALALLKAIAALKPGGRLHVVDFGAMAGMPAPLRRAMQAWLRNFNVHHRPAVRSVLARLAARRQGRLECRDLAGGYAEHLVWRKAKRGVTTRPEPLPTARGSWTVRGGCDSCSRRNSSQSGWVNGLSDTGCACSQGQAGSGTS